MVVIMSRRSFWLLLHHPLAPRTWKCTHMSPSPHNQNTSYHPEQHEGRHSQFVQLSGFVLFLVLFARSAPEWTTIVEKRAVKTPRPTMLLLNHTPRLTAVCLNLMAVGGVIKRGGHKNTEHWNSVQRHCLGKRCARLKPNYKTFCCLCYLGII